MIQWAKWLYWFAILFVIHCYSQRAITTMDMEWILPRCLKTRLRSGKEKDLGGGQEPDRRWCFR